MARPKKLTENTVKTAPAEKPEIKEVRKESESPVIKAVEEKAAAVKEAVKEAVSAAENLVKPAEEKKTAEAVKSAEETKPVEKAKAEPKKKAGRKPKAAAEKTEKTEAAPKAKRTRKPKEEDIHPFFKAVNAAKDKTAKAKPAVDFAAQVMLTGEFSGIFYVKTFGGYVDVQPYNYEGADLYVTVDYETFMKLSAGKGDVAAAVKSGALEMTGAPASTMFAFIDLLF